MTSLACAITPGFMDSASSSFDALFASLRVCRVCRDAPRYGAALPHEPRPVFQVSRTARLCIAGQAPGARVHASGRPYTDPSGVRLRSWLGIGEDVFYDASKVAIVAMGFCFPGLDGHGGDLPPRRECAEIWRARVFAELPNLELILQVGSYAQKWHLGAAASSGLTATVQRWREIFDAPARPRLMPTPHPSWRNNAWLKRNPWFEDELLPALRAEVARVTADADPQRSSGPPPSRQPLVPGA